jgi:tetratricopeptide (TPR) repeat protein
MPIYRELKNPEQYHKSFRDGFSLFTASEFSAALPLFNDAINNSDNADSNIHKYRAYYGRTLFNLGDTEKGLALCQAAAENETRHSDVFYHMACIANQSQQRELAIKSLAKGSAINPQDTQLLHLRSALGIRRKPVLGFFSRKNLLNMLLGKLTYRWYSPADRLL